MRSIGFELQPRRSLDFRFAHAGPAAAHGLSSRPFCVRLRSPRSPSASALEIGGRPRRLQAWLSGLADDALLTGGSRVFQRHPVLTLAAALLAGVALGREN